MNATWWHVGSQKVSELNGTSMRKCLPGKDFAFLAAEPSAGVGHLLIEGVYDARHRDDG